MIDRAHMGRELEPHSVSVEASRLRLFAKATGEDRPEYIDEQAAKAAGFSGLPVPPTFLYSLENEVPDNMAWLVQIGMDIGRVLHGEQSFTYKRQVFAGDVLTFRPRISNIYDKKDGALEFVLRTTEVTDEAGEKVAELQTLVVHRRA